MFDDVGNKIKGVASVLCWIGIICSILLGLILISGGASLNSGYYSNGAGTALIIEGLIVMVVGCLFSWIGSLMVYGFGELIDNSNASHQKLGRLEDKLGKLEEKLGKMEQKQPVNSSQQASTTAAAVSPQGRVDLNKSVNYNADIRSYDQLLKYLEQFDNAKIMLEALQRNPGALDADLYEKLCALLEKIWSMDRVYGLGKEYTMREIKKFLAQYESQRSRG